MRFSKLQDAKLYLFDTTNDFVCNHASNAIRVALEDELISDAAGNFSPLGGQPLSQGKAILQAHRLYQEALKKIPKESEEILWWEILAPQIILYFVSKILRSQDIYARIQEKGQRKIVIRSTNKIIAAFAKDHMTDRKDKIGKMERGNARKSFFKNIFSYLLASYRCLKIWSPSLSVFSKSNSCDVLIWCQNKVHEATGFAVADVLKQKGKKAACLVNRNVKNQYAWQIDTFRNLAWLKNIFFMIPELRRVLGHMARQLLDQSYFPSKLPKTKNLEILLKETLWHWYIPQAADAWVVSGIILDHLKPSIVLIQDIADFRTRALAIQAHQRKIPVIHHQFGSSGACSIEWRWDCVDVHSVWGKWSEEIALQYGVEASKIHIAGTPRMAESDNQTNGKLSNKKKVLFPLVPSSPLKFGNGGAITQGECKEILRILFKWAEKLSDKVELLLKPRPLSDDSWYLSVLPEAPKNIFVLPADRAITKILEDVDAVITTHSTVAIDAILAEKPLIIISLPSLLSSYPFAKQGVAMEISSEKELTSTMERILWDPLVQQIMKERQRLCRVYLVAFQGRDSAINIAELILNKLQRFI